MFNQLKGNKTNYTILSRRIFLKPELYVWSMQNDMRCEHNNNVASPPNPLKIYQNWL
jgi:hypothetical protein